MIRSQTKIQKCLTAGDRNPKRQEVKESGEVRLYTLGIANLTVVSPQRRKVASRDDLQYHAWQ